MCISLHQEASIPKLSTKSPSFSSSTLSNLFEQYKAVHLVDVDFGNKEKAFTWNQLSDVFAGLGKTDQKSWCVETAQGSQENVITPEDFLAPKRTNHRAYCSFLVQKDRKAYDKLQSTLPVVEIPGVRWAYEPALWMFFGRNPLGNADLPGRPDHTDSISADGTWHFQLSGTKKWIIRPSDDLIEHMSTCLNPSEMKKWSASSVVQVTCRQGDILIIK